MGACVILPSVAGSAVSLLVAAALGVLAAVSSCACGGLIVAAFAAVGSSTLSLTVAGDTTWLRAAALAVAMLAAVFSRRRSVAAVAAAVGVSVVIHAFGVSCAAAAAVDGAVIVVAAGAVSTFIGAGALYAAELLLIIVFLGADDGLAPRSRHLTWWGVSALAAADAAALVLPRRHCQAIAAAQATVALTVAAGTVTMSVVRCGVLLDAFASLGGVGYIAGNFLIHYYPAARGFSSLASAGGPPPVVISGAVAGVSLICAYAAVVPAAVTYQCAMSEPVAAAALAGGSVAAAVGVFFVGVDHFSRVTRTHGAAAAAM